MKKVILYAIFLVLVNIIFIVGVASVGTWTSTDESQIEGCSFVAFCCSVLSGFFVILAHKLLEEDDRL